MSRKLSLLILASVVIAIGVLFFQVVQPFLLALLCAAVLAVLFRPAFVLTRNTLCRGHARIAAGLCTMTIVVLILLPLGGALGVAGVQLIDFGTDVAAWVDSPEESNLGAQLDSIKNARPVIWVRERYDSALAQDWRTPVLG